MPSHGPPDRTAVRRFERRLELHTRRRKADTTDVALGRARGKILRLVRRRSLAVAVGLVLAAPAAWVELSGGCDVWWIEGLALVLGATGLAILWTGVRGARPDWIDDDG